MVSTRDQEFKALADIKRIIEDVGGADSYIGIALEGCLEIAEDNIKNDFACSMKQLLEKAEANENCYHLLSAKFSSELDEALKEIEHLKEKLESELEWRDYKMKGNTLQCDYKHLAEQTDTRYLNDEEAKDLVYEWYGFAREKIKIISSIPTYQINRHGQLRQTGTVNRHPVYFSTDWNYIRFDCGPAAYEIHDGTLNFFN